MSKYIDLSVPISEKTPIYPGDEKTVIKSGGVLKNDGYCDHYISMGTHVGTHIDAPAHMVAGTKSLNEMDIDRFIGRGRYIKIKDQKFDIDDFIEADIQEGDIVIIDTGMSELYGDSDDYFEKYPQIPDEIAQLLIEKKISIIGVDMCSPDHYPEFKIHKMLLKEEIMIIENLTNLSSLAGLDFRVIAVPPKFELEAAPVRVLAEILG